MAVLLEALDKTLLAKQKERRVREKQPNCCANEHAVTLNSNTGHILYLITFKEFYSIIKI